MNAGNEFALNGVAYVAQDAPTIGSFCTGCAFDNPGCEVGLKYHCDPGSRSDQRNIIWKKKLDFNEHEKV